MPRAERAGLSARRLAEIRALVDAPRMTVERAFALRRACADLLGLTDDDDGRDDPSSSPEPAQMLLPLMIDEHRNDAHLTRIDGPGTIPA